ncbi:matrix metalloproteinase-21-like [Huso huso]|uniref:Matrix metalloproteinase-21-like n=1 Tax=Huso huso TaxID=61971 RepID=A0ABR1A8L3_HUSHU
MVCLSFLLSHMLLLSLAEAEKLYHSRDHSDIQLSPGSQAGPILTSKSAKQYLDRYGWIKPVNWESLDYHDVPIPREEDPAPLDILSFISEGRSMGRYINEPPPTELTPDPSFIKALKRFQEANSLPVTGLLDSVTKVAMNRPRCGVPDHKASPEVKSPEHSNIVNGNSTALASHLSADNDTVIKSFDQSNDTSTSNYNTNNSMGHHREKRFLQRLVDYSHRKHRAADYIDNNTNGLGFSKATLKWRLLGEGYSAWLPIDDQRYTLKQAFRMWSEVMPLNFEEDLTSLASQIDIKLGFGTRKHLGCSQAFDGTGQVFAHAWHLGDIHFDDDEHFVPPKSDQGISLLKVAVHEIGHVLGLSHINRPGSVMQANYIPQDANLELDWMDRKAIQQIYGACENSFSTVFDWVYKEMNQFGELAYRFNTYFFRNSWYWMYENRNNRTRYGDPNVLGVGWHGIPSSDIDGFVHIWTWNKDYTLFFKGTQYWRYDSENDQAYTEDPQGEAYPKLISDGFPEIPSPIDSAFFDKRDHNIYFFRGNNVTAFNVDLGSRVAGYPRRIVDVFPAVVADDHPVGNLNAVYFSYYNQAIYFFKDRVFWKMVDDKERLANPALPYNGLLPHHKISEQWFDICDVHPSMLNVVSTNTANN